MTIENRDKLTASTTNNRKKIFFILGSVSLIFSLFCIINLNEIRKIKHVVSNNNLANLGVCDCNPSRKVCFQRHDGLEIAASIYGEDSQKRPGIIFLHGDTPLGKELPFYKVIATKLAAKGYLILAIDLTGFGESEDPYKFGEIERINNSLDAFAALDYFKTMNSLDREKIYIIGHSRGSTPAFDMGIISKDIKGIIGIGPARRMTERFLDPIDRDYFWQREQKTYQQVYGRELPQWYDKQIWLEQMFKRDIGKHIPYFSNKKHKPLLLIDGERETQADKDYLQEYYQKISEPKKYVTIANSNHYANTDNLIFDLNIYDVRVVSNTINAIDKFIDNIE